KRQRTRREAAPGAFADGSVTCELKRSARSGFGSFILSITPRHRGRGTFGVHSSIVRSTLTQGPRVAGRDLLPLRRKLSAPEGAGRSAAVASGPTNRSRCPRG